MWYNQFDYDLIINFMRVTFILPTYVDRKYNKYNKYYFSRMTNLF